MISWRWIISHRCSWIAVYVLCCNAQMNLIVIFMSCTCIVMHSLFVNCPAVIYSPSMLFIFMERHLYWTVDPSTFFYIDNTIYCKHCFLSVSTILFHSLQTNISFHTILLILCFQQNQWDWQPYCKLGQSSLVVLCAGSTLLTDTGSASCQSQLASTFRGDFFLLLVD
jgi:hypothetical protein